MRPVRFWLPMALLGSALMVHPGFAQDKPQRPTAIKTYGKWCSDCHSKAAGPGSVALQRRYQGAVPAILEQRNDLNADYVRAVVRTGISFMPSFRKTEISDAELAQLADYLAPAPRTKRVSGKGGRTRK